MAGQAPRVERKQRIEEVEAARRVKQERAAGRLGKTPVVELKHAAGCGQLVQRLAVPGFLLPHAGHRNRGTIDGQRGTGDDRRRLVACRPQRPQVGPEVHHSQRRDGKGHRPGQQSRKDTLAGASLRYGRTAWRNHADNLSHQRGGLQANATTRAQVGGEFR